MYSTLTHVRFIVARKRRGSRWAGMSSTAASTDGCVCLSAETPAARRMRSADYWDPEQRFVFGPTARDLWPAIETH
jgi:hypothetical protein